MEKQAKLLYFKYEPSSLLSSQKKLAGRSEE
jgi:hypothetical protein